MALLLTLASVHVAACGGGNPRPGVCELESATVVENEGWQHVTREQDLVYAHNPPASGPHFPQWASWGVHDDVVPRGNWVHNLEHGGVILLLGPDADEEDRAVVLDAFDAAPEDPSCGHKRVLLTDDPALDSHVAAVAADVVLEGETLELDELVEFITACRNRAPEDVCQ